MTSFYKYGVLTRAQKNDIVESERRNEESAANINWESATIQINPNNNIEKLKEQTSDRDCSCCGRDFETHMPKFVRTKYQLSRWNALVNSRLLYVRNCLWFMDQAKLVKEARSDVNESRS